MFDTFAESFREAPRPVTGSAIGHHCRDLDTNACEDLIRGPPEPGSRVLALIFVDLGGRPSSSHRSVVKEPMAAPPWPRPWRHDLRGSWRSSPGLTRARRHATRHRRVPGAFWRRHGSGVREPRFRNGLGGLTDRQPSRLISVSQQRHLVPVKDSIGGD